MHPRPLSPGRFLPLALACALPLCSLTSHAFAQGTAAPATNAPAAAAPAGTVPAGPVNLALNKPFVSSDPNTQGWNVGLTDGTWRHAGKTVFATGSTNTFPKHVTVNLEAPTSIGYVAVGVPQFGSTRTVSISLSTDGTTFTDAGMYEFTSGKAENHLFTIPATTAQYVRLTFVAQHKEMVTYPVGHGFASELAVYAPGEAPKLPEPPIGKEATDVPYPKYRGDYIDAGFLSRHESFLKRGKEGPIGVLFLGDSITQGWSGGGNAVWKQHFSSYQPANFGIGGDRTQHVLWRIANGELDGINPKVVVLMIGTNNMGNPAEEIIKGNKKIVEEIGKKLPNTKLLLLGIFPRHADGTNPVRTKIKEINAELAKLDNGNTIRFLDIGDKFLDPQGNLTKEIMPDALHLSPAGYKIWAEAMLPQLQDMMK